MYCMGITNHIALAYVAEVSGHNSSITWEYVRNIVWSGRVLDGTQTVVYDRVESSLAGLWIIEYGIVMKHCTI